MRNMDQRQIAWILQSACQKSVTSPLPEGEMRKTYRQDLIEIRFEKVPDVSDYCSEALRQ